MTTHVRAAPYRRTLLPIDDELDEGEPTQIDRGRFPFLPAAAAVAPEVHAANSRLADAILGTSNYEDVARSAVSDLASRGGAAAPGLRNLLNQLHERDPEVARSFAGSVSRLAKQEAKPQDRPRAASPSPQIEAKRTIGHFLFPGQVDKDDENFWAEAAADVIPIVGNIRSASQAARDVEEVIAAFSRDDYLAAAGHGFMALVDGLGAVPMAGNLLAPAKPALRAAVRATPGLKRAHAGWTLAKAARQFDTPLRVSPEKLYGQFWDTLPLDQRRELRKAQKEIAGFGGENYQDELLTSGGFRHHGDKKVQWGNPTGRPRIYDAETAEQFEAIFFGLFAVPWKRSGKRTLYELKTAGGELTPLQKKADAIISQSEHVQYLRLYLDQIPFEFLASKTRDLLQKSDAHFSRADVDNLIRSMRRARTPEGKPLTAFDWLGTISRISAEAVRSERD